MLKKFMAGLVAAGAVAIPLSGVAWADKPADPGGNGNHGSNSQQGGNGTNPAPWGPSPAPGQNPFGPPGQVKQAPTLTDSVPNPFFGVPLGHWDDPALV